MIRVWRFHPARNWVFGSVLGLALLSLVGDLSGNASAGELKIQRADPSLKSDGTMSEAARRMLSRGPLPVDAAALASAKAAADQTYEEAVRSGRLRPTGAEPTAARLPASLLNFEGVSDTHATPSDSTGAVGPTRYIETINDKFAIYNKTSSTPISTGGISTLWDSGTAVTSDPQIIWDPKTQRFYYAGLIIVSSSDHRLTFGFSKTASPNTAADFCKYTIEYASILPDYPKLGDSADFAIIGVNGFFGNFYVGSDLLTIDKPPAGTGCGLLTVWKKDDLRDTSDERVNTPVPGNEIDDGSAGYAVAISGILPSTNLWLFKVTKDATGRPVFGSAQAVPVPSYTVPPDARQGGGFKQLLSTLDGRNTQAIIARNPDRGDKLSLWTQHTIGTNAVSVVRWYEINPVGARVLRSGNVT